MKNIMIGLVVFMAAGSVQASPDCRDMWGNRIVLKMLDSKHLQVAFSTRKYPNAKSLSYNGSNSTIHYFVSGSKMAQVQKTVFTQGVGKVWYSFPTNPYNHPGKTTQSFDCR